MKINKKYFVFVCITIIIILIIIFAKNNYKKFGSGNNNIGNSNQEISEYILNINSYNAKLEVTINSNKNENKYILTQEFSQPNIAKQVVQEPSNIEGLTIINDGTNLSINNTKLNLTKIYENYNYITENHLFLNTFIKNYKESEESKMEEKDGQIIMKTDIKDNNKYLVNKTLYIDKKSKKPTKMKIEDINQNVIVYIVYNEIELNSIN